MVISPVSVLPKGGKNESVSLNKSYSQGIFVLRCTSKKRSFTIKKITPFIFKKIVQACNHFHLSTVVKSCNISKIGVILSRVLYEGFLHTTVLALVLYDKLGDNRDKEKKKS